MYDTVEDILFTVSAGWVRDFLAPYAYVKHHAGKSLVWNSAFHFMTNQEVDPGACCQSSGLESKPRRGPKIQLV